MLSLKEYRILKTLRNHHYCLENRPAIKGGFLSGSEYNVKTFKEISRKLHIRSNIVGPIIQHLVIQGYLDSDYYTPTPSGLIAIDIFPKDVLKSAFTVYLPIVISIAALIISIFF